MGGARRVFSKWSTSSSQVLKNRPYLDLACRLVKPNVRRALTSGFSSYNEAMTVHDNQPMKRAKLILKNTERIAWRFLGTWQPGGPSYNLQRG